jgi:Phosphatidylethanolamine-binding protein
MAAHARGARIALIDLSFPGTTRRVLETTSVELSSGAFAAGQPIPRRYSCAGEDLSPPLVWRAVPAGAVSLVLIVDDPDAPVGTFTHWLAWGIEPVTAVWLRVSVHVGRVAMTSGRSATGDRVRRVAMGRTGTSFACTRSRVSLRCRRPRAARSLSAHSRTTSSPWPSLSAPMSDEHGHQSRARVGQFAIVCSTATAYRASRPPAAQCRELRGPRGYSLVCSMTTV